MSARLYCRPSTLTVVLLVAVTVLPLTGQETQGKKYALLVGVKVYDHAGLSNLDYTENDVAKLAELLRGAGYQATLLCDSTGKTNASLAPTRDNVFKHLQSLLPKCKRYDTLLVGFAGHGLQFEGDKASYFCPQDARPSDPTSLVSLAEVYSQLEDCGAGVRLVLVDACRSKVKKGRGRGVDGARAPRPPDGVMVVYSCSPGEISWESNELRHGLFFYYVLQGLGGEAKDSEGEVTTDSLVTYVRRKVSRDAPRLIGEGVVQYPHAVGEWRGEPPVLVPPVNTAALGQPGNTEAALGKEVENSIGLKLVRIPAGKFLMGSPQNEADREPFDKGSETQHEVQITRPFYLGVYEVTQAQYERVMGANPSWFSAQGGGKEQVTGLDTRPFPVENVSWEDAVAFCRKLSDLPAEKAAGRVYVLPTEAEWEYACRGGAVSYQVFHYGNSLSSQQANFDGDSPYGGAAKGPYLGRTTKVGSYQPNAFGLCDMHGNVWEWCADWYDKDYYRNSDSRDPKGPNSGERRVLRGGAWTYDGLRCRAAIRDDLFAPGVRNYDIGFRVVWRPGVRTP